MSEQSFARISGAVADFRRARRQADLEDIFSRLTGQSAHLLSYEEVRTRLKAQTPVRRELREIPLDAIVGSVGRYNDFTRSFLPRFDSDKDRWARVKVAVTDLGGLPPIEVYQIGEAYFVLDGNHRVSVARQLGAKTIQAYVTTVRTRVPLSPEDDPDDLIVKAEYVEFLEQTRLDEIRPGLDLRVTAPGKYQILLEHIAVHRYFMGLEEEREIPYEEAAAHWYDTVYLPVAEVIRRRDVLRDFPGRTEADLYLWLSEHRAALQEALGWEIAPEAAAADLASRHGERPLVARLGEKIRETILPEELEPGPPPGQWRQEIQAARREDRLFDRILTALNGAESGWQALEQALQLAQKENGQVFGLHVLPSDQDLEDERLQALNHEFERRRQAAGVAGRLVVESGPVARTICDRSRFVDLTVVSLEHPPGPTPLERLGSGFRTLVQRCPRPILAVPGTARPISRNLLAYDGSPRADEALYVATYLGSGWQTELVVIAVDDRDQAAAASLHRARTYLEKYGVAATFLQESGPPATQIMAAAEGQQCDLILMGGYSRSPMLGVMLGSTVDQVLRESERLVLISR